MNLNPVILAIPMYFTLMGVELVATALQKKSSYRLNDAVTNISTGTLQQMTGTFLRVLKVGVYVLIYEKLAFWHIEPTWWSFAVLFILWDLCYYWEHRFAHEVSLFWGGHSVHHQSEDYNLSVALRQSSTSIIWGFPFYLPLAFLGFDPTQFVLVGGFNLLYQFWIHTEYINRLPRWAEWLLNTPSHHRVHHGRDPKYLDKNYAGVFIIWDRMFGTFQQEEERPHYGVTKPLNSWNPVYANFAHYIDLWGYVRQARSLSDALKILFYPPGWLPDYLGGFQAPGEVDDRSYRKYDPQPSDYPMQAYILIQFFGALAVNSFYFFNSESFHSWPKALFAVWIIVTTTAFGFLLEMRSRWMFAQEAVRLASLPLGLYFLNSGAHGLPAWAVPLAAAFAVVSLVFIFYRGRQADIQKVML